MRCKTAQIDRDIQFMAGYQKNRISFTLSDNCYVKSVLSGPNNHACLTQTTNKRCVLKQDTSLTLLRLLG